MRRPTVRLTRTWKVASIALAGAGLLGGTFAATTANATTDNSGNTATPIKHVVVIFDENISYDHYFGTYPVAANTDGKPFYAAANTPANNNLVSSGALTNNPNIIAPFRLTPAQSNTCDQNHAYKPEELAVDGGKMDNFVETISQNAGCGANAKQFGTDGETMGYFDGNTVPALWNLAQNYAMSDNSWDTGFGPSTPGALNLVSGQTGGAVTYDPASNDETPTAIAPDTAYGAMDPADTNVGTPGTVINDPDPVYDDCADTDHTKSNKLVGMQGRNIGDLLNAASVTWGWFQGGFTPAVAYDPSAATPVPYAKCAPKTSALVTTGAASEDYSPHHNPFAYYASTSNPHHFPGTPGVPVGSSDPTNDTTKTGANHQYDLSVFDTAAQQGKLPAVSFVKAAEYQDGHPGYSDPTDEQNFLVKTINELEAGPEWSSTAIVIAYDDSDGWYDHVAPKIENGSNSAAGNDAAVCITAATGAITAPKGGVADRCGPSQRQPLLVISPYAKKNFIDHTPTDQVSILKFIEQNWKVGTVGTPSALTALGAGNPYDKASFDSSSWTLTLNNMFDFASPARTDNVVLAADGTLPSTSTPPSTGGSTGGQKSAACNAATASLNAATAAVTADTHKVTTLTKKVAKLKRQHQAKALRKARVALAKAKVTLSSARTAESAAQTLKATSCA